jgi:hypothetical protein
MDKKKKMEGLNEQITYEIAFARLKSKGKIRLCVNPKFSAFNQVRQIF